MSRFPGEIPIFVALFAFALQAEEPKPVGGPQLIPARELRGFGKLSGQFTRLPGGASHLEVRCETDESAKIVHAKYINDLKLFQDPQAKAQRTSGIPSLMCFASWRLGGRPSF